MGSSSVPPPSPRDYCLPPSERWRTKLLILSFFSGWLFHPLTLWTIKRRGKRNSIYRPNERHPLWRCSSWPVATRPDQIMVMNAQNRSQLSFNKRQPTAIDFSPSRYHHGPSSPGTHRAGDYWFFARSLYYYRCTGTSKLTTRLSLLTNGGEEYWKIYI